MSTDTGFRVETFQTGEHVQGADGAPTIAMGDIVQVALVLEGRTLGAGVFTPAEARIFAREVNRAANALGAAQIDDAGRPQSFMSRLFGGF
jgi:hypothetical protein